MSGSSAELQGAGVTPRTSYRPVRWRRRVARGVELLVMVVAVYLGGVGATSLFPTAVQTSHYRAEVRLSALPSFTSTIHSPTTFGDLDLKFTSPFLAPGVDATVQVRDTITQLFDDRRISIVAFQPSSKEISDALGSGVTELGLKFAGGVLVVGFGAIALIAYARRRPPTRRQVASTAVAALLAVGGTGVGVWGTYQPDQLSSFTTTGLLGTVRSNAGLLADVEARAAQVTPYVANLLALSAALQEKFVPAGITEPELSGIFTAIKNLGVPYIFVRGNHDASSLADQTLLERMAKIANVMLLEPTPQSYTEVRVSGVVIAGFNDPRFFGDDNRNIAQKEQPAADAFNQAYAGRPRPDIVVAHEPSAAMMVESATLLINGHLHKDELEGNRIGVGTFTGGGIMSHFLNQQSLVPETGDQPGELAGQPYAFDISDYGQRCDLTSLTRYTFRNLILGRPVYDNVSVINGKTIATREAGARTCGTEIGVTRTTVTLGG